MKVEYKLLRMIADPFRGDTFTVGALLRDGDGVRFVQAKTLPGPECLGSAQTRRALDFVISESSKSNDDWWTKLPVSINRFVEHSEEHTLNVQEPLKFIVNEVLPNFEAGAGSSRSPSRILLGERYFSNFHAGQYVKKNLQIKDYYVVSGYTLAAGLHTLGKDRLILIEPILPSREGLKTDISVVAQRYQSWRLFEQSGRTHSRPLELYVTVLPGGDSQQTAEFVEESVGKSMDKLFLMDSTTDLDAFLSRVEDVGASLPQ